MESEPRKTSQLTSAALLAMVLALTSSVWLQSSSSQAQQVVAPPPAPERWRGLIGEYGTDKAILYILENDGKLCASFARAEPQCLTELSPSNFKFAASGPR